jgi:Fur family peroxide stress response transcriptional regulator
MTQEIQAEKRVAAFLDICRRQGVKATHQRTEILRELARSDEHPDAEMILGRVRQRIPAISVDTIYRTLKLLEDKGVIARVGSMRDRARFDANTDRHHHFICTECGMIGDFYSDAMDRLAVPREVSEMGSVLGVYVELRGICRRCKPKAMKTEGRTGEKPLGNGSAFPAMEKPYERPVGRGRPTKGGVHGVKSV